MCAFDREKDARSRNEKKKRKESKQTQLPGFELALLRQLLASGAWNFTTQPRKQNTRYYVTITWPVVWNRNTSHAVSKANKGKKKSEVNRAIIFCRKEIKAELIVTFQKIFSSMADFLDVVSVLPCNPTNKGKKNLCVCAKKLIDRENWSRIPFSSKSSPQKCKQLLDWRQKRGEGKRWNEFVEWHVARMACGMT